MKKAYGYLRVSGAGQIDGGGFDRQKAEIQRFGDKAGIEIARYFQEEGVSGTTDEMQRPEFQSMVEVILKNEVRSVVIEGLDRLAREYRIQETLLIYLASKGIDLYSARTEENVTEAIMADPMKKALVQIQGVFSELEKNLLVKKLRVARRRKKLDIGKCEGRKNLIEVAPNTWKALLTLHRKPKGKPRMTSQEIADELNRQGMTTTTGKPWTGQIVRNVLHLYKRTS